MIASIDVQAKHRKLQSLRFHGTGEWLLNNDKYLGWKHASSTSYLCCYGIRTYGLTWLNTCEKAALTPCVHLHSWVWQKRVNVCIAMHLPLDTAPDGCFAVGHESSTTFQSLRMHLMFRLYTTIATTQIKERCKQIEFLEPY